ncbi:MAG TPA: S16 family serine protease [Candidatus Methanoperedens sp.]
MLDNTRLQKIIIIILSVLLVGSSFFAYYNLGKITLQEKTISSLSDSLENQKTERSQLEKSIAGLRQNFSVKEELLKNETQTRQKLEKEIISLTTVARSQYYVLAVDENDKGHVIPLEVIIKSGKGNLYPNIANVRYDETLQSSVQIAILVAREVTRTSLSDKDVEINIESPVEAQGLIISGGSAGTAITLAAIAAMEGKTIRKEVLITGTINEDHTIGRIGAARAKAMAAKDNGAVLFLVPSGQKSDVGDVGIEVLEVETVEDAIKYAAS